MNFYMNDVGFGDCFLLSDNNDIMMVDCGTLSLSDAVFHPIVDTIKTTYIDGKANKQALITHFHLDHYSGFEYISSKHTEAFNKVFIPYLTISDSNSKNIVLLELAIYCYFLFGRNSYCYKLSEKILKQIDVITKLTDYANIFCLSTGDQFDVGNKNYEVIWPDREFEFEEVLKYYLEKLNEIYSNHDEFMIIKDKIIENMKKWFTYTSISYDDKDSKRQRIEELIKSQKESMKRLDELKRIDGSLKDNVPIINDFRYFGTKIFARDANSTSIVFHDCERKAVMDELAVTLEADINNKDILMTGDISKRIINKYLKNRFKSNYYILKAPHHGTESSFSKHLLRSDKILISTGYTTKNCRKIYIEYEARKNTDGKRVCSSGNNFCEVIDKGRACMSSSCSNNIVPEIL